MISTIITLSLQILRPLITFFFRNMEKKQEANESFFEMIDKQSKQVTESNRLRREYEQIKLEARKKDIAIAAKAKKEEM